MSKKAILIQSIVMLATSSLCFGQASQEDDSYRIVSATREAPFSQFRNRHASTAIEGFLNARGNLVVANSRAAVNLQAAMLMREKVRAEQLTNRQAEIQANYDKLAQRRAWHEARVARNLKRRQARKAATSTAHVSIKSTAEIVWPEALKSARYGSHRRNIDALWTATSQMDPEAYADMNGLIRQNLKELARTIVENEKAGRLDEHESKIARKFVRDFYRTAAPPVQPSLNLIAAN